MYQAIYRKYRPKIFDDIIGQDNIVATLKNQILNEKIAHSYIFTGSRGTGKTSCAKIFSKAVNCENPQNSNPCLKCSSCLGIENGSIVDVIELDAASNNKVDDIRIIKEEVYFTPYNTKYKVYIIDEVHMLSISAFNALLKVMEEPPSYVIFILATTEIHKVPATIISRCQRYDFKRIPSIDISKKLMDISSLESINLDESGAMAISVLSDGGMRDALSILDVVSAQGQFIDDVFVKKVCCTSNLDDIFYLSSCIFNKDIENLVVKLSQMHENSIQSKIIAEQLILVFRNLLIASVVNDYHSIINCFENDIKKYDDLKYLTNSKNLIYYIENLSIFLNNITNSNNKKIDLEICLIKITACVFNVDVNDNLDDDNIVLQTVKNNVKLKSEKKNNHLIDEKIVTNNNVKNYDDCQYIKFDHWSEVIKNLKTQNPILYGFIYDSECFLKDDTLLIKSKNKLLFSILNKNVGYLDEIKNSVHSITNSNYNILPFSNQYLKNDELSKNKNLTINKFIDKIKESNVEYEQIGE